MGCEFHLGIWVEDARHGKGTQTFSDGRTYTGEWSADYQEGEGEIKYPGGEVYQRFDSFTFAKHGYNHDGNISFFL